MPRTETRVHWSVNSNFNERFWLRKIRKEKSSWETHAMQCKHVVSKGVHVQVGRERWDEEVINNCKYRCGMIVIFITNVYTDKIHAKVWRVTLFPVK